MDRAKKYFSLPLSEFQTIKVLLASCVLLTGNLLWEALTSDLQTGHVFVNSPLNIALFLFFPIFIFAIYLSSLLYFSIFEKQKKTWFFLILFSCLTYPFSLQFTLQAIIGELVISGALFFFLINFHSLHVISMKRPSFSGRYFLAIGIPTLIMSVTIGVNFYNFYRKSIVTQNAFFSSNIITQSINPIFRIYIDDLDITNLNEQFSAYMKREALQKKISPDKVRNDTLRLLNLTTASETDTMRVLDEKSIRSSLLQVFTRYRKQVPLIASLGLAIITQTLLSVSILLGDIFSLLFLRLFQYLGLIRQKKLTIESVEITSTE